MIVQNYFHIAVVVTTLTSSNKMIEGGRQLLIFVYLKINFNKELLDAEIKSINERLTRSRRGVRFWWCGDGDGDDSYICCWWWWWRRCWWWWMMMMIFFSFLWTSKNNLQKVPAALFSFWKTRGVYRPCDVQTVKKIMKLPILTS